MIFIKKMSNQVIRTPESIHTPLKSCMKSDFTVEGCYLENLGSIMFVQGKDINKTDLSGAIFKILFNIIIVTCTWQF